MSTVSRLCNRYERYISLPEVRQTWYTNLTDDPKLEPCFAAGMQAIELGFILISQILLDKRSYVFKRFRTELIANDIQHQIKLLAGLVDGELEEERITGEKNRSLTKALSLENGPPILNHNKPDRAAQSPGLDLLIAALSSQFSHMETHERQSVRKMIACIVGEFETRFRGWEVKIGIEEQLSKMRELVGLTPLSSTYGGKYLDYRALVCPEIMAETLTYYPYTNQEDFFFRSIHLGTECWAFIAHRMIKSALEQARTYGSWYNAATHILSAANVINYLGDHVSILTSLIFKDYMEMKVELEGISGAGSTSLKELVKAAEDLINPLEKALLGEITEDKDILTDAVMELYSKPDNNAHLHNYAMALESIDTAIVKGFFYSHYRLASSVIGSSSKGSIKVDVQYLKNKCDTVIFPVLDSARVRLHSEFDKILESRKGRMTLEIDEMIRDKPQVLQSRKLIAI